MLVRPFIFSLVILCSCLQSSGLGAQSYDANIGLRLGTDWGISGVLRVPQVHKNFTVEGILQSSLQRDELIVTLMGRKHSPLLSRRLNVYVGGGLQKGWNTAAEDEVEDTYKDPFGITGVMGAELSLGRLNVGYDFKPALNLVGGERTLYIQSGITLRYVVAKRNDIWDKQKEKDRNKNRRKRGREKRKQQKIKDGKNPDWWKVWKKD